MLNITIFVFKKKEDNMPYYYGDWTYIVLVVPFLLLAMLAQAKVNSTFSRYSTVRVRNGMTGAEVAKRILDYNRINGVRIERTPGRLTDHYDPKAGVIRLSDSVYDGTSCAAMGVAAHEVGHVLQYARNYAPIRLRNAIIPITQFGSMVSIPLFVLGFILASVSPKFIILSYIGLILFGSVALFQFFTLPAEFDASRRALTELQSMNFMTPQELEGSRKVLSAAALTYVAALAVTLMQLLRFAILLSDRDRRR